MKYDNRRTFDAHFKNAFQSKKEKKNRKMMKSSQNEEVWTKNQT